MVCDFGEMGGGGVELGGVREAEERARDMKGRG